MARGGERETRREPSADELGKARARITELEAENARLREELGAAQTAGRGGPGAAGRAAAARSKTPTWIFGAIALGSGLFASGLFVFVTTIASAPRAPEEAPAEDGGMAEDGAAVLEAEASADPVDRSTQAPELAPESDADCEVPFHFDEAGIKIYRPECLDQ